MFDMDEIDISAYNFVYPAKEIITAEFNAWVKKIKKSGKKEYQEFIIPFVKERVQIGFNRLHEFEPEWEQLRYYINIVEKEYGEGKPDTVEKAIIIYDQCLQLFYEGYPLPPNITY